MKVCIVGGVAGGAGAATRLRRIDEKAEIIMFEKGKYISYANCGLPYYVSKTIAQPETLIVTEPELLENRFNIDVRTLSEVTKINKEKKTITVMNISKGESYEESYDKLILSPGASPKMMFENGADMEGVFTLRTVPDTKAIRNFIEEKSPRSAVVVGGGFIGIEMAENLREAGMDVTIIEFAPHIIASMDYEMANIIHEHLAAKGVGIRLKTGVTALEKKGREIELSLTTESKIMTDLVIMSVGVNPESKLAKDAGLELGMKGTINVNEYLQTSDPDIYAVGDVINIKNFVTGDEGMISLAGPANRQGRNVADNVLGAKIESNRTLGSSVLKAFDLTAASTGLSEELLKRQGKEYLKTYVVPQSHASYYPGATPIVMKMLFNKEGKILGAQAVGNEGVEKRIDVLATSIVLGASVYDLVNLELCYAPPFSSAKDPVNMLGFTATNILKGDMKVIYAEDMDNLDLNKIQLLDIREKDEMLMGGLDGSININVDELRNNLDKLDKNKPVYTFCMVGLRGYIAEKMLENNGFEAYNLSGGYAVYKLIKNHKTYWEAQDISACTDKIAMDSIPAAVSKSPEEIQKKIIEVDARGLQCPGPIMSVAKHMKTIEEGDELLVHATDPGFASDIKVWCERTGNTFLSKNMNKGVYNVSLRKGTDEDISANSAAVQGGSAGNDKAIVVFSGDLDKTIAAFIIANGAASMGRQVTLFFTFWGLNALRKPEKTNAVKSFTEKLFGKMMPRGTKKMGLSQMNMFGMGSKMIRSIMKNKNVDSVEELMQQAMDNGVRLVACQMTMDLLGIKKEELIDGVEIGGVASFLGASEVSDTNLFI